MLNATDANEQQAIKIYNYKCTKNNLYKTNVAISYNNMFQISELIPKYIKPYISFLF
jgi:hypothetical protein